MSGRFRGVAAAIALSLFTCTAVVHADATTDAAALKQFEAGRAAFDKNDFAAALAAFQSSMQALPSPNTRLYIARCQKALGKTGSAFTSYRLAAREAADRMNATGEKRFAATRETALAEAADIEKSVPHLTITLPSDAPPSTVVTLDDTEIPRAALSALEIDPGVHTVRVRAPRRALVEQKIDVAAGRHEFVQVTLSRLPTATVKMAFKQKPAGLALEVDGRATDARALEEPLELDAGAHTIVVRAPGYRDFEWKQSLADGDVRTVEVALEGGGNAGSRGTPQWLFFGVAGLSVAALGVATYFAVDATSRADGEKGKDPLLRSPKEQDDIKSEATTANVLFIAGAAIAGGAGALAFITDWGGSSAPPPPPKAGLRIKPWIGPLGAGARGSF